MAEDFDPTGMTIQQLQDAGHDVALPDQTQPSTSQDEFNPVGMTLEELQKSGAELSLPGQQQQKPARPRPEGMIATGLREAAHSALPFAAGFPGMLAGGEAGAAIGTALMPGPGTIAGALIGGAAGAIPGAYLASKAQEGVLDAAGLNDQAQREANRRENPISANLGELGPAVATFRIGDMSTKLAQRLLMGAGMGAIDVGQQMASGAPAIDWTEVATQAGAGAVLGKPRGWAQPMASRFAKFGQDFAGKYYPSGRPDLSDLKQPTAEETIRPDRQPEQPAEEVLADKAAVKPYVPTTSPNRGAVGVAPEPSSEKQPFTGYDSVPSPGNVGPELKPELQNRFPFGRATDQEPSKSFNVVNSQADDPTIAAAIKTDEAPASPPQPQQPPAPPPQNAQTARQSENPAEGMPQQIPQRPQRPPPPGLSPADLEALRVRRLPFAEQLRLIQEQRAGQPAAEPKFKNQPETNSPQFREAMAAEQAPAAQAAAATSKKLPLPKKAAAPEPTPEPVEAAAPAKTEIVRVPSKKGGADTLHLMQDGKLVGSAVWHSNTQSYRVRSGGEFHWEPDEASAMKALQGGKSTARQIKEQIAAKEATPPAAQTAIATSKKASQPRTKLALPKNEATEKPAGALKEPAVTPSTPPEPEDAFARMVQKLAPNAEAAPPTPKPSRFTNMEVSAKTIRALRATGNEAHKQIADKIDRLPPGQQREQEAARVWAAMHSQTGEVPTKLENVRVRSPESYKKLEVPNYINPVTGKPVRTKYASDATAYGRIHDINERVMANKKLAPPAKGGETEEQVKSRAQNILGHALAEAKAEAAKMREEANRPGSNLTDADKKNLLEAADLVGNGKLPVDNYAMSKLMKPPAWRLVRHAKDFLEGKFPEDPNLTPHAKFLADEALIRGGPDSYAEFVKNNIAEAASAKKTEVASDIDYAQQKNAARQVAAGKATEEPKRALARPEEEASEETLGERLKRERMEDRVLDKLRSKKFDAAADKLEQMPLGEKRNAAFKYAEENFLKAKPQAMARDKIKRPKDSIGYDKLNEKILAAGAAKVEAAKAEQTQKEVFDQSAKLIGDTVAESKNLDEAAGKIPPNLGEVLKGKAQPKSNLNPPYRPPTEYAEAVMARVRSGMNAKKNVDLNMEKIGEGLKMDNPELFTPEVYDAERKDRINDLPEKTRDLYLNKLLPMQIANDQLAFNLRQVAPDIMGPLVENHVARVLVNGPRTAEFNEFASGISNDPMKGRNLKVTGIGSTKARAFVGLEYADGPQKGTLQVISHGDGEGITFWNNHKGTRMEDPDFKFEAGKEYTAPNGQKYKMVEAPEEMIENNALLENGQPPRYARNLPLSILKAHSDLVHLAIDLQTINQLKRDPEFLQHATTNPTDPRIAKHGWIKTDMPTFQHWWMEPRLAQNFDDYWKPGFHDTSFDGLRKVSQGVTSLIFLFPTVHLFNVAGFGFVQRGSAWLKPAEYRTLLDTSSRAIKSVMEGDDLYQTLRERGLVLMDTFNDNFLDRLAKATGESIKANPRSFELLAKLTGEPPANFVRMLYNKSKDLMWTASNMIVVQGVLEREAQGMSRDAAIKAVEAIIPNYRIGTHFLADNNFGRFMAKLMSDPATMAFGPYHVGVVRAFGHMLNNAVRGKGQERTEAIAQLAMMGVLGMLLKPYVFDPIARLATGNPDAEFRAPGPLTIPTNAVQAGLGEKDISQALRDTFTVPPLASTALSLIRNQNFAGRPIIQPQDIKEAAHGDIRSAGRAAIAAGEFTARGLVAPYNLAAGGLTENKQSIPGVIRDQLMGISNPTDASVRYKNLKPKFDLRARKQEMKTEKDPVKRAYDYLTR